jgi:hypothetical protein
MAKVVELIGVYDADGTPWGEVRYWLGAGLGRTHCALCDITHGSLREKPEWRDRRDALPAPFRTVHRDEVPDDVESMVSDLPAVFARTDEGVVVLLDRTALDACDGDPDALATAVRAAMTEIDRTMPGGP